jgi:glycosyltransferase involved in cell wall biosynthesis
MDNSNSLVSICIPTYNSKKFLRQCLDSIVAQTYKNVEVIVSDNASQDDTVSIIRDYVERNGFKLHINSANIGAGKNFNKLIGLATGKYVAIYHADDVYESTIVEEAVRLLESDETIGLVGTMGNVMNEQGVLFNTMQLPKHLRKLNKTVYTFDEALSGLVKRGWFFVTPSIMVRKKIYDELGVFDAQGFVSAGDYAFWLKIAHQYKVGIIDKKLINYRVHKNQGTEREVRRNLEVADIVLVLRKYKELTSNIKIKKWCENCINANIITAARRQNYYGMYAKSNETLATMKSKHLSFLFQKYGIRLFNILKTSLKKRTLSAC